VKLVDSPTERTTAATDVLLALVGLGCAFFLWLIESQNLWKVRLWATAFLLLTLSAIIGAIAHGIAMSPQTNRRLWQPLNLSLGLVIACFVVGVTLDMWGQAVARWVLPLMVVAAFIFFTITQIIPHTFLIFIIYQAIALLFALVVYAWLALTGQLDGASWMVAGIIITILAATLQTNERISFTIIWPFDHNGLYHLVQIVGIILLVVGLRLAL
jgi:hypothetical protein